MATRRAATSSSLRWALGEWGNRVYVIVADSTTQTTDANNAKVPVGFRVKVAYLVFVSAGFHAVRSFDPANRAQFSTADPDRRF